MRNTNDYFVTMFLISLWVQRRGDWSWCGFVGSEVREFEREYESRVDERVVYAAL